MYLIQMRTQEEEKNRTYDFIRVEKKSCSDTQIARKPVLPVHIPVTIQNNVLQLCPTVRERTKNAKVGDRHNIPHPFFDLGDWYKTLMSGRIADLFKTQEGFLGHAVQINQELSRLINACEFITEPNAVLAVEEYTRSIKCFIVDSAKEVLFDIPYFVFYFPNYSTLSIEKKDGILRVNGKK